MEIISTPHIQAPKDAFGKTVLMPGDPLRSKYVAENFLENPVLVNNLRGIEGYTGTYKGIKVSVMASGMGIPSMNIYSYELYNKFNVENIIRIGTAGSMQKHIKVRDIVVALGATTNSNIQSQFNLPGHISPIADYSLIKQTDQIISKLNLNVKTYFGSVFTSDQFYNECYGAKLYNKLGILCVDMETAGLYLNAMRFNKKALSILTISDSVVDKDNTTSKERETTLNDMIVIALELAKEID